MGHDIPEGYFTGQNKDQGRLNKKSQILKKIFSIISPIYSLSYSNTPILKPVTQVNICQEGYIFSYIDPFKSKAKNVTAYIPLRFITTIMCMSSMFFSDIS